MTQLAFDSLDVQKIETAVVKTVARYVGEHLTQLKTKDPEVTIPAVYRSKVFSKVGNRKTPPRPAYPYALVNFNTSFSDGSEHTQSYWDWNCQIGLYEYITEIHTICSINIAFYGNHETPVDNLVQRWHSLLELDHVRHLIKELSKQECNLRNKSNILPVDAVVEDKYTEIRSFDMMFAVMDIVTTERVSAEYFETIDVTSNLTSDKVSIISAPVHNEQWNDHQPWSDEDEWEE